SAVQLRTKKVFVVHGHDEIAKMNLEVFLREVGLEPVVLHRQADEGLTIIEKFEKHSDVGYAFILLTPDEVAYLAVEDSKPESERRKEFRARPNVIFEFGYFVGKLGRSRVCCLYTGNVSLPSDVSGMIYKRYERSIEDVAYSVIKDLKASGYDFA
ncbi:MAG: nucleotide-binding protein, partial [Candidatus Macondimonas sp.]